MVAWQATGRGKEGRGKGSRGAQLGELLGGTIGRGRAAGGAVWEGLAPAAAMLVLAVREKKEEGRRKREEKKRKKRKEKKRKNMEKNSNSKNFREKNKRQFVKLVKIIFVQERNNPNYN
jgi:hypothetical protein